MLHFTKAEHVHEKKKERRGATHHHADLLQGGLYEDHDQRDDAQDEHFVAQSVCGARRAHEVHEHGAV